MAHLPVIEVSVLLQFTVDSDVVQKVFQVDNVQALGGERGREGGGNKYSGRGWMLGGTSVASRLQ